ncbi:phage tail terminator protein [Nocardia terpenica]|uniref:DUF3168 domain-containing protein n=1 Tax=Nocardia terpenica TaxID=455432 RepID=A0A6G9YZC6_9NOCA|nr:minor capsid protein [Nocardia terpenica]QIS18530.1 hypothetical protein F6W96_09755 [Nocardia terpenica]
MITGTRTLLDALARHLAALGLARYQPTDAYPSGALPAVFWNLLPPKPDDAISITIYDEAFDRDDHNPDVYVQLRWRTAGSDPRTTDDAADLAARSLHDISHLTLPGGVRVLLCRRKIRGLTTSDATGRFERADSYVFTLNPGGTTS